MTGGVKGGDVIAVVIGIHLCSSGNGSGRVMATGRDHGRVDMRCQRRLLSTGRHLSCPKPRHDRFHVAYAPHLEQRCQLRRQRPGRSYAQNVAHDGMGPG
jgi:hypothetical protein